MSPKDATRRVCAVIFVPVGLSLDGHYAAECVAYVISRGYQLVSIVRDWEAVDASLLLGSAQVVVVARAEHRGDRPAEVAGERTQVVKRNSPAVGRCTVRQNRNEISAYRTGYADGYVDCLTLGGEGPA